MFLCIAGLGVAVTIALLNLLGMGIVEQVPRGSDLIASATFVQAKVVGARDVRLLHGAFADVWLNYCWSLASPFLFVFRPTDLMQFCTDRLSFLKLSVARDDVAASIRAKYLALSADFAVFCNLVVAGCGFFLFLCLRLGHEDILRAVMHALYMGGVWSYVFGTKLIGLPVITVAVTLLLVPLDKLLTQWIIERGGP